MSDDDPDGCPACNTAAVTTVLDRRGLVALEVRKETPGATTCDTCGRAWWVVDRSTGESPT